MTNVNIINKPLLITNTHDIILACSCIISVTSINGNKSCKALRQQTPEQLKLHDESWSKYYGSKKFRDRYKKNIHI